MLRQGFGPFHMAVRARRAYSHRSAAAQKSEQPPRATLIICTNPRSGSWLLSTGLAGTAAAGYPREWFNPFEQQRWKALWRMRHTTDLTSRQYLRLMRQRSMTENRVSGIKLHAYQLPYLQRFAGVGTGAAGLPPTERLPKLFSDARYVWLTRGNRARQAISLELAFRTNRWWSIGGQPKGSAEAEAPAFDPAAIARWEEALTAYDSRWSAFFKANSITPATLTYEDLVADYEGSIRSVLRLLDVPDADAVAIRPARLRRQSDARSEAWLAQYETLRSNGALATLKFTSIDAQDPIEARTGDFTSRIPPLWKRWIAHARLQHLDDGELAAVLTRNGYDPIAARAAVAAVMPEAAMTDSATRPTPNVDRNAEDKVQQP
jgi:trehalose 2-sulfotransferase